MRTLKFRAWDKKRKRYAKVIQTTNQGWKGYRDKTYITNGIMRFSKWVLSRFIIEQYTGLKDKNGKEVYEGDIVRVNGEVALNDDIGFEPVAVVVWVDSAAGFGEKFTIKKVPMVPFGAYEYEVIGNIHENPELLEDEK